MDLFAGIPVSDYAAAVEWYGRPFGSPPTFHGLTWRRLARSGSMTSFIS